MARKADVTTASGSGTNGSGEGSPSFDAGGFYEFDLATGSVRDRAGERVVVLTESVFTPLVQLAVHSGDLTALRELGGLLGARVQGIVGDPEAATPSEVFSAVAGYLAVFGWGRLEVQRWGDALAFRLHDAPAHDEQGLAVSALLGGLMSTLGGADAACVPVADGVFLLVAAEIAEEVWGWAQGAEGVGALVTRLTQRGAA